MTIIAPRQLPTPSTVDGMVGYVKQFASKLIPTAPAAPRPLTVAQLVARARAHDLIDRSVAITRARAAQDASVAQARAGIEQGIAQVDSMLPPLTSGLEIRK